METQSTSIPLKEHTSKQNVLMRRQTRWILFIRVFLYSMLLMMATFFKSRNAGIPLPAFHLVFLFIVTIYIFSIMSAFLLQFLREFRFFAWLQVIFDSLITTIIIYATGGSQSPFSFLYFFPVMSGGLILLRKGGFFTACVCLLFYGSILATEYYTFNIPFISAVGKPSHTNPQLLLQYFSTYGLTFFLIGYLTALLSERIHRTEAALTKTSLDFDRLNLLYKQIFDDITSGIITVDRENRITSINRAAMDITGYSSTQVSGQRMDVLFPNMTTDDMGHTRPVITLERSNGQTIPVGYSWAKLNMPENCEDCRVYTLQDLSKIKAMEEKVKQAEKMAAIGEIAAGIAHEFRNPLAAISGAAQVLSQEAEQNSIAQRLLTIITRECGRLEGNIVDFLQFSKPATPEKKWIGLLPLVNECLELLPRRHQNNQGNNITLDIPRHLDCFADQHQIKQVIINLIDNAGNAVKDTDGTIRVLAKEIKDEQGHDMIEITISDSGQGIEENILASIWEPFFTTRENGTGLGLAIVKQIIEAHGGTIVVRSEINKGTAFTFQLPLPKS